MYGTAVAAAAAVSAGAAVAEVSDAAVLALFSLPLHANSIAGIERSKMYFFMLLDLNDKYTPGKKSLIPSIQLL